MTQEVFQGKTHVSEASSTKTLSVKWLTLAILGSFGAGFIVMAVLMIIIMPSMMIVVKESRFGFDETVAKIEKSIQEIGWNSPGTMFINQALKKHNVEFAPKVKIIQLCQANYAKSVLTTDRYLSCLMPCSIAVWENDKGKVFVSKMNTGLMGKLFGGNVAKIMGTKVSNDEHQLLRDIVK